MGHSFCSLLHHLLDNLQDESGSDQYLLDSILPCYGLENLSCVSTSPSSIETRKLISKVAYSVDQQEYYQQTHAEFRDPAIISRPLRRAVNIHANNAELKAGYSNQVPCDGTYISFRANS